MQHNLLRYSQNLLALVAKIVEWAKKGDPTQYEHRGELFVSLSNPEEW
jgi:hypothetical protein